MENDSYKEKLSTLQTAWGVTYRAMALDFEFASGGDGMWQSGVLTERKSYGLPSLSLPLLPPYIDRIVAPLRQSPPSMAVRTEDEKLQELVNGVLRGIERASTATTCYATALKSSATGGLGWLYLAIEAENGEAVIRIKSTNNPTSIMIDPLSEYIDGRDAQYAVIHGYMDKGQAIREFGEEAGQRGFDNSNLDMTMDIPSTAVLDCIWYELEDGGCRITRRVGAKEVYNQLIPNLTELPIVPIYGEILMNKGGRKCAGIINRGREINENLNLTASNIMLLVASAPKQPWILDPKGIEGNSQTWASSASKPHAWLPFKSWDYENNRPLPQPMRMDNSPQTQSLQGVADWLQSLIGRTNGISDAMLGGLETATESGKSLIARMRAGETATAMYIDNLMASITQLSRVLIQMLPIVYQGNRSLVLIDEYGQSSRYTIDLSVVMNQDIVDMLDVEAGSGPHMEIKSREASDAIETMISAMGPEKGLGLLDIWAEHQPIGDRQKIKKRLEKIMPPEFKDEEEGEISAEVMQVSREYDMALAEKELTIRDLNAAVTKLQADVNAQREFAQVELQKAIISAQTKLEDRQMQNQNRKEVELIKQGSEDQRLSAKLTAEEQARVDEFTAELLRQKNETIVTINDNKMDLGVEKEAKLPQYISENL